MSLFHWTNLESQVLSKIQRDICDMKSLGSTKAEISARFNISYHAIYAAIRATMNGNHWEPNMSKGGGIQYIGEVDEHKFIEKVKECHLDLNCLKTIEAVQFAYDMRYERYSRAIEIFNFKFD